MYFYYDDMVGKKYVKKMFYTNSGERKSHRYKSSIASTLKI